MKTTRELPGATIRVRLSGKLMQLGEGAKPPMFLANEDGRMIKVVGADPSQRGKEITARGSLTFDASNDVTFTLEA